MEYKLFYPSIDARMQYAESVISARYSYPSINAGMRCTKLVISRRYSYPSINTRIRYVKSVAVFQIVLRYSHSILYGK